MNANNFLILICEKKYHVVAFYEEENATSVVPSEWIKMDGESIAVSWPPYKQESILIKLCRERSIPGPSWKDYPAKIIYSTRSYDKALNKLSDYLARSDVEQISTGDESFSISEAPLPSNSAASLISKSMSISTNNCSVKCTHITSILKLHTNLLEEIRQQVRQNTQMLQFHVKQTDAIPDIKYLPVNSVEDLQEFNVNLENDEEFSKVVKVLGILGGKDHSEACRRIISRIMINDVALRLNWQGGEKKTSIKEFPKVLELVAISLRQNKLFCDVTQFMIEDTIKRWLRCAPDRDGGRNKRRKITL